MESTVSQQLRVFGWSILLGMAAGLLYDLLRPFRLRLPRLTVWLDLLYCLAVGSAAFLFLLRRAGVLRMYLLVGMLGGAVVFFCALSSLLRPAWRKFFAKKCGFAEKISFILQSNVIQ